MTTGYSTNLELALPVQGELSGTWGDTVNNGITQYLDAAIAGSQIISGSQTAVTLTNTNGDAAATNIAQAGSGATGTAQYQIIRCTGNPAGLLTITVSDTGTAGYSKTFIIINATSTSQSVKIVGSGPTTGITVTSGDKALVAWNGTDFVRVGASAGGSNTQVQFNSSGNLAGSANLTFDGTILTAAGFSGPLNGTVGATTANTGAFTTLSASGTTTLSGNQIISVTDNTNAALRITQLGTGNALLVEDSTNPDASPFVIDSSGIAIQGNTSTLSFSAPAGTVTPTIQSIAQASSLTQGIASVTNVTSANGPNFIFGKSRGASASSPTIVSDADVTGTISFTGYDGAAYLRAAQISANVDGTPGTNDMPGRLVFSTTADGASTPTERLRISSTGAFGLSGANYGTSGQVLTSGGSSATPTWTTPSAGGGGGTGSNLYLAVNFGGF